MILDIDPITASAGDHGPGTIIPTEDDAVLCVATGDGSVRVNRLQLAGKRAMSAGDFLRGHTFAAGDRFGRELSAE